MGVKHVVITTVNRDDLPGWRRDALRPDRADGPCAHRRATSRRSSPHLQGDREALKTIVEASPKVLGHNMETVPRLPDRSGPWPDTTAR